MNDLKCNCGYGGFHEPLNPRCQKNQPMTTPDPYVPTTEEVRAKFGVEHFHPQYGNGWFFTTDALESLLATAGADGGRKALRYVALNQLLPRWVQDMLRDRADSMEGKAHD